MRLAENYKGPRYEFTAFLCDESVVPPITEREALQAIIRSASSRWPGVRLRCSVDTKRAYDDPFPGEDPGMILVTVQRLFTVVRSVTDPSREIAVSTLPSQVWAKPPAGGLWYENIAFIFVPPAYIQGRILGLLEEV